MKGGGIFGGVGLVVLAAIALLLYLSVFIVDQTQQALVLRFGQVVRPIDQPGLYYKLPLIDNVEYIDKRILDLDSPPLEIIASDQKRLVVDAFGRYKIVNPLRFFQSVGSTAVADSRLSVILNSAVRRVLGDATFIQLVRDDRSDLMAKITTQVDREAESLGIDVIDVKIRRADLPEANSQAIYQRMQTERQRQATEIRAQGEQAARGIRAQADREATVIVAEANRESETIRGAGEAEQNNTFASAF
ncbi:MAG: protease modulator HflC, partial [Bauldia sp.]